MANVPPRVAELIETFDRNIETYKKQPYNEAQVRSEFIDPFFEALGWDVTNRRGYAPAYKDVIHEDAIKIGGATEAPDYCFRIGDTRKFFVEAKKPSIDIKADPNPAYQLRRYAWSAKLPLSILTDFEEFAVYDCQTRPKLTDKATTARIMYYTYKEYIDHWHDIESIFSRDAILKGSFDKFAVSTKAKRGTTTVDIEFLKEIEEWRRMLARTITLRNIKLSKHEINFAVQRTIDRILFLRMCEDRGIERYQQLLGVTNGRQIYPRLCQLFRQADAKYNSGLFHFRHEKGRAEDPDELTLNLIVDDTPVSWIIRSLYYPKCPYVFSVLPAEILGNVYEQFLGKVIRITPGHRAVVEEKPEVKKAGGVYYTPAYIVDYIVKNTVGKLLECHCEEPALQATRQSQPSIDNRKSRRSGVCLTEKFANRKPLTPKQISNLRILDPACGSGSFLLAAYTHLLNHHRDWYVGNNPTKHPKKIYQGKGGQWYLTIAQKKKILLNNIFGVDIDSQAVEVTKLSLLLKVLEGETSETIGQTYKIFHERALPDLGNNIKCGNSLIGPDFYEGKDPDSIDPEEYRRINPFDYKAEFPHIFKNKNPGFNAIIGNPPYLKEYTYRQPFHDLRGTRLYKYYQGKMDLWYIFACWSLDLLNKGGLHSFIAPNNWITNYGASKLRQKILSESNLKSFSDFGSYMVFQNTSIQTMIYLLEKTGEANRGETKYKRLNVRRMTETGLVNFLEKENVDPEIGVSFTTKIEASDKGAVFTFVNAQALKILDKIRKKGHYRLTQSEIAQGIVLPQYFVISKHLSKLKGKEINVGDGIFTLSDAEKKAMKLNKRESKYIRPFYTTEELGQYYGNPANKLWVIYTNREALQRIREMPNIRKHLDQFKEVITSDNKPYGLHRARKERFFTGEKIISLRKTTQPHFTYTDFPCYVSQTFFVLKPKDINLKYLTGLLNSRLVMYWLKHKGKMQGDMLQVDREPLIDIPIRTIDFNNPDDVAKHDRIVKLVDRMLDLHKRLTKAKVPAEKTRIQRQINTADNQIDKLVYELYNLTKEEIKIVENG